MVGCVAAATLREHILARCTGWLGVVAAVCGAACAARALKAAAALEELADRCEKVASQIDQRVKREPISDRLVSLADPHARPIRKGKLNKPDEFGYVSQHER